MSNLAIAENYARTMASMLKPGGIWPHSLDALNKHERKQVIKIYRQYFSVVEVNGKMVVCKL